MATISDYNSLVAAILAFSHRANLASFVDYLIQQAQEQIETDIPAQNCGSYLRFQEAAYPSVAIDGNGHTPVPSDWLGPKNLTITGLGVTKELVFKAPGWIYAKYPFRGPDSLPRFVAREVSTGGGSWPTVGSSLTFTATANQTVFSLAAGPAGVAVLFVVVDGATYTPTTAYTIAGTTLTFVNGLNAGQQVYVQFAAAANAATPSASGTSVLIYGPYPDGTYTVQGTYYQTAPLLASGGATTNWMVLNAPGVLHAACMIQVGLFIPDDKLIARWTPLYQQRLQALIDACKAEVWSAGTAQAARA